MADILKFQKVKLIDEEIFQDITKDQGEGVLGFDKYRNFTILLAEQEEGLIVKYKSALGILVNQQQQFLQAQANPNGGKPASNS